MKYGVPLRRALAQEVRRECAPCRNISIVISIISVIIVIITITISH